MKSMFAMFDRLFAMIVRMHRAQARSYESRVTPRMRLQPIPVRSRRR